MSFLEHLEEARGTLIVCILSILGGGIAAFVFVKPIANFLMMPYNWAIGSESQGLAGLTTTGPLSVFTFIIQVGFLGGICLALPIILYSVGKFVAPGLKKNEVRLLRPVCIAAFFLFNLGALFSFFVLVPASMRASIWLNNQFGFIMIWTVDKYFGLLVWMVLAIGVSFEFPLLLIAAIQIGLVSTQQLKKFRPYTLLIFLIVSAMITPTTDPITFLLLAGPMMLLYEGGIFVGARIERKKQIEDD